MNTQVNYCYYHQGKPAVSICAQCGAGICRDCAVKGDSGKIICISCGNNNCKQDHKEFRKMLKQRGGRFVKGKEFILPSIIGILIAIAPLIVSCINEASGFFNTIQEGGLLAILVLLFVEYVLFAIPFGMIWLGDLFASKYENIIDRSLKGVMRFFISIFIGWIFFAFYLIRFLVRKAKTKKATAIQE